MKKLLLLIAICLPFMAMANSGKLEFIEYKLDNGLHVILQQDHTTPNVIVSVMYHVGSKNEDPNLTGFAHFFEHLMFEGTANIARHEYDKYVMNAGGRFNANTYYDRTFYFELMPSNQLALGLWLESERMLHPSILPIGIQTQKDVVCQEMEQTRDNRPYGRLMTETMKHAYTVHPYQHDVLGSEEHIRNASDQDFINFFKKFYIPNNAALCIVGDFEIDEAKKLIHDYFNDIPAGAPVQQPAMNEPKKTAEVRAKVYDNIQLPALIYAYSTPEMTSNESYAVSLLNMLLSSGESSRLYSSVVSDQKLALQLSSFPMPLEHPGISMIFGFPNITVSIEDLEKAIDAEIEKIQNELISDNEFKKLQNQIELQLLNNTATISKRAENLCYAYLYYNDTESINKELDKYMAVTKEDIQKAAQKYFVKTNRTVLHYLPKEK
ncbi:insulinase family protein [Porphyromonadaceae bacterium OttesenSCG-928-L07]|nr:insulinase family protein [Porphyromonadaceae bacterium OttesenSCG-928-L07]MDL2251609.1 insulinase family protein [Odoribacter sp. OttesenSCG-928-J03]MDL2330691.1 insulinase family protein [Odoribacter sp. OttesenSCG-928-A06]